MIVVIWMIPTAGVPITSFRPGSLVGDRVVDGARPSVPAGQWTLENYRLALDTGGFASAFLNSLAIRPVHPDHDRCVRRLRVLLDGLPRPVRDVIAVVGLLVVPLRWP